MKHIIIVCTSFFLFRGCYYHSTIGSGKMVTENRNGLKFSGIAVSTSIDVEVKIGQQTEVKIEADDNVLPYVKTNVETNVLHIGIRENNRLTNVHIKAYITVPNLNYIEASASANVNVLDVLTSTDKISFHASSSSEIKAQVDAPNIIAKANSSATVTLSGRTKNYQATVSSSGNLYSENLKSENTTVEASSSGTAKVFASVKLNADATSSGSIIYQGAAQVNEHTSSSGSVEKK